VNSHLNIHVFVSVFCVLYEYRILKFLGVVFVKQNNVLIIIHKFTTNYTAPYRENKGVTSNEIFMLPRSKQNVFQISNFGALTLRINMLHVNEF
jgi:hypothetical protein